MRRELLFILPTYGHFAYARRCLESFVNHTPQDMYYVLVIDDGSPDWFEQRTQDWPFLPVSYIHYTHNLGLTRSWNHGLSLARRLGFEYTLCGNSDLLFTDGWYEPMKDALETFDLVGPVTNAPGHASWQNVNHVYDFQLSDDPQYLNKVALSLRGYKQPAVSCRFVNGFCLMAKTKTWWANAFDRDFVFDPKCRLTGNEDELQKRWNRRGCKIGFVPRSFVFHYRSVSRPQALSQPESTGAYRYESPRRDDRVQPEEHRKLVDACVEERREIRRREAGCGA
jgi:GT2 family glycosyltransferase